MDEENKFLIVDTICGGLCMDILVLFFSSKFLFLYFFV